MHVQIENQKRYRLRWWDGLSCLLLFALAIFSAFQHWWIPALFYPCYSISLLNQPRWRSARLVSTITLDESRLVITYRNSKEMVILVAEIEAVVNIANKTIIRFYRNEEVQHFELKRSEYDEDSWQQIRRLKSRIGI